MVKSHCSSLVLTDMSAVVVGLAAMMRSMDTPVLWSIHGRYRYVHVVLCFQLLMISNAGLTLTFVYMYHPSQVSASVYSGYEPETEQRPSPELQRSLESVDSSLPSPSLPHPPETQQTTGNVTGSNGNTAFKVPTASGGEITRVVPTSPQVTVTEPHKVESKEKPRFKHQEDPSNNDIPIDVNVQIVQPEEFARQQQHSPDEEDIPKSKHISGHDPHHLEYPGVKYPPSHKIRSAWITRPNQAVVTSSSEFNPSVSIEVMDPAVKPPSLRPSGLTVTNKFGNLLENCNAEGSDVSAPKPRIVQARNHEDLSYSTGNK